MLTTTSSIAFKIYYFDHFTGIILLHTYTIFYQLYPEIGTRWWSCDKE